jgi:hypothetical protein
MRCRRKYERTFKRVDTLRLDAETRDIVERQREAFRKKFGREPAPSDPIFFDLTADQPRPLDIEFGEDFGRLLLKAARAAGLPKPVIAFIRENHDRDALFECIECRTQVIVWALARPACPDCGHHPMYQRMVIAK